MVFLIPGAFLFYELGWMNLEEVVLALKSLLMNSRALGAHGCFAFQEVQIQIHLVRMNSQNIDRFPIYSCS